MRGTLPGHFTNSAGSYDLLQAENGRAWYRFTNRGGKTVEADVSVETWQRLAARAKDHQEGADGAGELRRAA